MAFVQGSSRVVADLGAGLVVEVDIKVFDNSNELASDAAIIASELGVAAVEFIRNTYTDEVGVE